ncbi:AAA family ATPase [Acinetobacter vivianii]|uniref:AAA family ATPase n=1 Tax=Acinetobacter vivianii TaxID=1776742 RepID=UPI002DB604A3|nr:AAA family ATPase [Acinetobacter vivianii]MEB6666330.1 AAA family ATPase [Acinetobacter vivianii]
MRMPNAREISDEQQDIFEEAPLNGCILISGPPGTGKTVIAFLRAKLLAKKKQKVVVLMYNRVLKRYTENIAREIDNVQSNTMHTWFPQWWSQHRIQNITPEIKNGRVYLDCPFEQKEELKKLGGKWDKKNVNFSSSSIKKGMWYVPIECYQQKPEKYKQWIKLSYQPLKLEQWKYDWEEMRDIYLDLDEDKMVDWGHLIIDEGQDFEPDFYSFLYMAGKKQVSGDITVLADENQRLEEKSHSSLDDIRKNLKLVREPEREFTLKKNFRNTKQIAEVASQFYVGLETGIPNLPDKEGGKPVLVITPDIEQQINYICNYLRLRGALEVGVIVDTNDDRECFTSELSERLNNYFVQTYSNQQYMESKKLIFDKQGVITVLNRKSCKGLEFDIVFVPQLQNFTVDDSNLTTFKMNMYVICSRARSELVFMCNDVEKSTQEVLQYFPSRESGLIDYREQK